MPLPPMPSFPPRHHEYLHLVPSWGDPVPGSPPTIPWTSRNSCPAFAQRLPISSFPRSSLCTPSPNPLPEGQKGLPTVGAQ